MSGMECRASESASEFGVVLGGPSTATEPFETEAKVAFSTNRLLMSGASYTKTDPTHTIAPSSLKSQLAPFRINWTILRRLFLPQAGRYRTCCRTICAGFAFGLLT